MVGSSPGDVLPAKRGRTGSACPCLREQGQRGRTCPEDAGAQSSGEEQPEQEPTRHLPRHPWAEAAPALSEAETTAPPAPASIAAHQEPRGAIRASCTHCPAPQGPRAGGRSIANELLHGQVPGPEAPSPPGSRSVSPHRAPQPCSGSQLEAEGCRPDGHRASAPWLWGSGQAVPQPLGQQESPGGQQPGPWPAVPLARL